MAAEQMDILMSRSVDQFTHFDIDDSRRLRSEEVRKRGNRTAEKAKTKKISQTPKRNILKTGILLKEHSDLLDRITNSNITTN